MWSTNRDFQYGFTAKWNIRLRRERKAREGGKEIGLMPDRLMPDMRRSRSPRRWSTNRDFQYGFTAKWNIRLRRNAKSAKGEKRSGEYQTG